MKKNRGSFGVFTSFALANSAIIRYNSREPGAGSREPGAGSREPGAGRAIL
jgi:hypothetical protein